MSLRLYNTRTRTVEPFAPRDPQHVRVYVCGLTPSADAHLGHARSFLTFDVLRRYLVLRGYRVTFVQNVTDIDDRSIATARERGGSYADVVNDYYGSFKASMQRLSVIEPDHEPHATGYIEPIVRFIEQLVADGFAYATDDGVYYRVSKFPRYGALSGRNTDELLAGARIAIDEQKDDPLDFALWKFAKPDEPAWPSPWGAGRPGWHIECSAMACELLGEPLDIHGGGADLIFPHHENEIAQSEAIHAAPLALFWVHCGLLMFDGKKMSKSLGNFEPMSALLARHDPQAVRFMFLATGYRKPMNFLEDNIAGAAVALGKLHAAYDTLRNAPVTARDEHALVQSFEERFLAALDDDLNTASALAVLHEAAAQTEHLVAQNAAAAGAAFLHQALEVLGVSPLARAARGPRFPAGFIERLRGEAAPYVKINGATPEAAIDAVITARNEARAARDFARSDQLRDILARSGVTVRDSKEGTNWSIDG